MTSTVPDLDVIDGTAVPSIESAGRMLAGAHTRGSETPRQALVPAAAPTLAVTPQVEATELVARLDMIREAQERAMVEDVDYGVVPGTDKPGLFKPGAEKLGVLFQLDIQLTNEKVWGPGDHLTVMSCATVFHAPTGARLGYGEGLCTTREKKYGKRRANRKCPECSKENIRRSRDPGEGFYCWRKTDGCGAKFSETDQRILGQVEGEIENPDLPDTWNTVVKMAEKRARVDAVLAVTGASALFTQDIEDVAPPEPPAKPAPEPRPATRTPVAHAAAAAPSQSAAPAAMRPGEAESRAEILACAKEVLRRGIWDERRLNTELVVAKAKDTSSLEAAVTSIPFEQCAGFHGRLVNILPADPLS